MNFRQFAVENARDEHGIERLVDDVLTAHGVVKAQGPVCKACRIVMRHVTNNLWQCRTCKELEAL